MCELGWALKSAFRWVGEAQGDEHAEGLCGGSVTLVVGGKGGFLREAALFLLVSWESSGDAALECLRLA